MSETKHATRDIDDLYSDECTDMLREFSRIVDFAAYVGRSKWWFAKVVTPYNVVRKRWQVKVIDYVGALNYYTFLRSWRGKRGYDVSAFHERIDELQKVANRKATQGVIAE